MNLLNLKFGFDYQPPSEAWVREYENKLDQVNIPKTNMSFDVDELLVGDIPRKAKNYEDLSNQGTGSGNFNLENSLQYKSIQKSNPNTDNIYNSTLNLSSGKYPLQVEARTLPGLVTSMRRDKKLEDRLQMSSVLAKMEDPNLLSKFMQLHGASVLSDWISEYKEKFEKDENINNIILEILLNVLNLADKLPISVADLKSSKIGRKINKLGKIVSNNAIKLKCEELVEKWKRMFEDTRGKKDKESKRDMYTNEDKGNYLKRKREDEPLDIRETDRSFKKYISIMSILSEIHCILSFFNFLTNNLSRLKSLNRFGILLIL